MTTTDETPAARNYAAQMAHTGRVQPPAKKTYKKPEAGVKAKVDAYLKKIGAINIRTNAGSWKDDQGNTIMGAKAGTSDHTCCLPGGGRFCAIEDKAGKNALSDAQQRYKARVESLGGLFIEARSAADVRAALVAEYGEAVVRQWEARHA